MSAVFFANFFGDEGGNCTVTVNASLMWLSFVVIYFVFFLLPL